MFYRVRFVIMFILHLYVFGSLNRLPFKESLVHKVCDFFTANLSLHKAQFMVAHTGFRHFKVTNSSNE